MVETIKTYQGTDVSVSQCLVTLELMIGDADEAELANGDVIDASDAVTAINGLIWSMERREAEIELLRAALKPFAAFAEKAEAFVEARAKDGGSPILPSTDFRLADFRRARNAISSGD